MKARHVFLAAMVLALSQAPTLVLPTAAGGIGLPVKLNFLNDPYPAMPGEPYSLRIEILAAAEADISELRVGGDGWSLNASDFPGTVHLKEFESAVVNLTATPADTTKPFVLSFRVNGLLFQKEYVFSKERYERLKNSTGLDRPVPRSAAGGADPGPPPDDAKITRQMVQQIAQEMRGMRRDIDELKAEVDALKAADSARASAVSAQVLVQLFPADDHILGSKDAPVTIVEYTDYECVVCRKSFEQVMPELRKKYLEKGLVRYVVRDYPLNFHEHALPAAVAAACAGKQGRYWEMHDALFAAQQRLADEPWRQEAGRIGLDEAKFKECVGSDAVRAAIAKEKDDATKVGVKVTPTFVIGTAAGGNAIRGRMVRGFQPPGFYDEAIESLLAPK